MKNAQIIFGCIIAVIFIGIGGYGFIHNLNYWGFPLILGFVVSGFVFNKESK